MVLKKENIKITKIINLLIYYHNLRNKPKNKRSNLTNADFLKFLLKKEGKNL